MKDEDQNLQYNYSLKNLLKQRKMLNNFVDYQYQPSHKIYTHPTSNFSIFLGDVSSALDIDFIKSQPIHVVVTAASGMDQVTYPKELVKHIVYPLLDAKTENISTFFNDFYHLVQRQILTGNILVHCAAGISRSATLLISYFIKKNNWTFKEAVKMVRDKRPIVLPNLGFERQLKQFQAKVKRQNQFLDIQRKSLINTSQSKKNAMYLPVKIDFLPGINNLGKTALLKRTKPLDNNLQFRLNIENIKGVVNKKMEIRQRQSQHNSGQLKKKGLHARHFNKDLIMAKIESGRNKLLQRSNNFMNMMGDNSNFDEQQPQNVKKLSSLSHRSQKHSFARQKIARNISSSKYESDSNLFEDLGKFMVSKLQLCERKFTTQKIPRGRVVHKLGQF